MAESLSSSFKKHTFLEHPTVEKFGEWLSQFQISESTRKKYMDVINHFLKSVPEINQETVNRYVKKRPRRYVTTALKYYFKFAGINLEIPKPKEPPIKPRNVPKWDELKEILKDIKIANKDTYYVLMIMFFTGARVGDVLRTKVSQIDFDNNRIVFKTKGGKYRECYLPADFMKSLREYLIEDEGLLNEEYAFFPNSKRESAYRELRRYIEKSCPKFAKELKRTHNFRYAFATFLYRVTKDPILVKTALGHADIRTTMRYIKIVEEEMRKEVFEIVQKEVRE